MASHRWDGLAVAGKRKGEPNVEGRGGLAEGKTRRTAARRWDDFAWQAGRFDGIDSAIDETRPERPTQSCPDSRRGVGVPGDCWK